MFRERLNNKVIIIVLVAIFILCLLGGIAVYAKVTSERNKIVLVANKDEQTKDEKNDSVKDKTKEEKTEKDKDKTEKDKTDESKPSEDSNKEENTEENPSNHEEPEKKKVWVVDKPAWDEVIDDVTKPIYEKVDTWVVVMKDGSNMVFNSESEAANYSNSNSSLVSSYHKGEQKEVLAGYEKVTIHHPEEGHWE